jgi:hypothetical protein
MEDALEQVESLDHQLAEARRPKQLQRQRQRHPPGGRWANVLRM